MKKYFATLIVALLMSVFPGCTEGQNVKGNSEETTASSSFDETVKPETTAEIHNETEFEITDWTFEDFVSDVEINGVKLSLPCSYEELSKNFDLQKDKYLPYYYDEEIGKYRHSYEFRNNEYLLIYAAYYSENGEGEEALKAEDMMDFFVATDLSGDNSCLFRFGEINNYSDMTQNDVETILGKPNGGTSSFDSWYWFSDRKKIIVINYGKNDCVRYVHCLWKKSN